MVERAYEAGFLVYPYDVHDFRGPTIFCSPGAKGSRECRDDQNVTARNASPQGHAVHFDVEVDR